MFKFLTVGDQYGATGQTIQKNQSNIFFSKSMIFDSNLKFALTANSFQNHEKMRFKKVMQKHDAKIRCKDAMEKYDVKI